MLFITLYESIIRREKKRGNKDRDFCKVTPNMENYRRFNQQEKTIFHSGDRY